MKKTIGLFLAAIIALTAVAVVPANADSVSGNWKYYVYEYYGDQYAVISGYTGSASKVTVPAKLDGLKVLFIDSEAFYLCDSVREIVISEGIDGVENGAISFCDNLKSINLPASLSFISGFGIRYCSNLETITVTSENPYFYSQDGILYENTEDGALLVEYPSGKTGASFSVPANVSVIGDDAFDSCFSLKNVYLTSNLIHIGGYAFQSCTSLKEVAIPESVSVIGDAPFAMCPSLERITVSKNNPEFCSEDGALYTKDMKYLIQYPAGNGVSSFVIPSGVEIIDEGAFIGCEDLKFVNASAVSEIHSMAFLLCEGIEETVLGSTLRSVGQNAFLNCSSLEFVTYWGKQADLAGLNIADGNDALLYADLIYMPIPGDVNLDLKVNSRDVVLAMKAALPGFVATGEFCFEAADLNGDGRINSRDIIALMKLVLAH